MTEVVLKDLNLNELLNFRFRRCELYIKNKCKVCWMQSFYAKTEESDQIKGGIHLAISIIKLSTESPVM